MKANLKIEKLLLKEVELGNILVSKKGVISSGITGHVYTSHLGKYQRLTLRAAGKQVNILGHRLVWIVYRGLIKDPSLEINHKNGIKSDNRLKNLELISGSTNCCHAFDTGLSAPKLGQRHGRSKFSDKKVKSLRKTFAKGNYTLSDFAAEQGVANSTMYELLVGISWSHLVTGYENTCRLRLKKNKSLLNNR